MWIIRIAGLALGIGLQIVPVAADTPTSESSARSKEMLSRAQSEANRRNAGGLLDHIEAQKRRVELQEAAKVMPSPPDDGAHTAPAFAQPAAAGGGAR